MSPFNLSIQQAGVALRFLGVLFPAGKVSPLLAAGLVLAEGVN